MPNLNSIDLIECIEKKLVPELFDILLSPPSLESELAARNELHRRGYSDEDIKITTQK